MNHLQTATNKLETAMNNLRTATSCFHLMTKFQICKHNQNVSIQCIFVYGENHKLTTN